MGRLDLRGVQFGWALAIAAAAAGCAGRERPPEVPDQAPEARSLPPLEGRGLSSEDAPALLVQGRQVGDYVAHRFSGSFRERPFTLVEEVVARDAREVVVDYTLEQGEETKVLRVRFDAGTDRVLGVSHLRGERELPAGVADYEALLALAAFVPDRNEGQVGSRQETCLVGPRELDCEIEKFRVVVEDREATLSVTRSAELDRDIAGEVRAVDGTILYRTELVDLRAGAAGSTGEARLLDRSSKADPAKAGSSDH